MTGAKGYYVYRASSIGGSYIKIAAVTGLTYQDSDLVCGTTYYYKIQAYCATGITMTVGALSGAKIARPVPAAPTDVKATKISTTTVKISWGAVAGATQYEVWRCTTAYTGTYSLLTTTANAYYTNTGLTAGKTYWYKVRAYRLVGSTKVYSSYSAVVYAKP